MSENGLLKNNPGLTTREKLQLNKRLVIFFIFIGIATFIWLLWTLEKEYNTLIYNPVEYVGLPKDRVLVNDLPSKIQLEVKGNGFAILRHNWDVSKSPLRIDFRELYHDQLNNEDNHKLDLSLKQIKTGLANQLHHIEVNSVFPDTITFRFVRLVKKMVPVVANLEMELEKQYMVRGEVKIIPDSIEISGPSVIIDTVMSVATSPLKLKNLGKNIQKSLALVAIHDKVSMSMTRVQIEIPVEQFTEKSLEVLVYGTNIPDSLHLKLFPAAAQLTFRVVVSEFEAIQPENFKLCVDYSNVIEGIPSKLKILILQSPEYISNIKINPETVGYILEK